MVGGVASALRWGSEQIMHARALPFAAITLVLAIQVATPFGAQAQVAAHETVQADLVAILTDLEDVASRLGDAEAARLAALGREVASSLLVDELTVILDAIVTLKPMRTRVAALRVAVDSTSASASVPIALAADEFPEPRPFPDVPVLHLPCDVLGNTAVAVALVEVDAIVGIVQASLEHECLETIEVVGEGGNLAIACAATGIIESVAKALVANAEFCRAGAHESLDDATYEGTKLIYEEVRKIDDVDADIEERLARIEDAIGELRALTVQLSMEQALTQHSGTRFARFQQPGSEGIDEIRAIVVEKIDVVESRTGRRAVWARTRLLQGDGALERGDTASAFRFYQKAYLVGAGP
jgi:hypothetical protein